MVEDMGGLSLAKEVLGREGCGGLAVWMFPSHVERGGAFENSRQARLLQDSRKNAGLVSGASPIAGRYQTTTMYITYDVLYRSFQKPRQHCITCCPIGLVRIVVA